MTEVTPMRLEVDEKDYKCEKDVEHIYNRPDMILSSDEHVLRNVDMYDFETGMITQDETDVPPAVFQLTVEAIANAADHIQRSRLENFPERGDKPSIEVVMDRHRISIKNYGLAVPIRINEQYGVPTPQFLFGSLRSSSNYKGIRTGVGRNGYGIKAVNIFSTLFELKIVNAARKMSYYQTWTDRMGTFTEPIIEELEGDVESSTEISYTLNFERFGMDPEEGYDDNYFRMVAHLVQSMSCSSKVVTRFNDILFNKPHILDYAACIHPQEALLTSIIHYELSDPETEEVVMIDGRLTPQIKQGKPFHIILPRVEAVIIDPSLTVAGKIDSFANGMPTDAGGVHVDAFLNQLVPKIVKYVNTVREEEKTPSKDDGKKPKGKGKEEKGPKTGTGGKAKKATTSAPSGFRMPKIKGTDVKPNLTFLLFVRVEDPKFDSQIKSKLCSPAPSICIKPEEIEPIYTWEFMDRLKAILKGLEIHSLTKTDGSRTGSVNLEKGFDANEAGKRRWRECTLIVTEGDSAMAHAIKWVSFLEKTRNIKGRDIFGVIPLRGKILNTRKATPKRILKNKEWILLKEVLGLKEGQKSIDGLRYGHLMIMADADDDGSHIKCLLANLFDDLYPALLEEGFLQDYRTKYLCGKKGGKEVSFYTEYEFREWKALTPAWKTWKFSYYKGLGTHEKADIEAGAKNPKILSMVYDPQAKANFELIFGKGGTAGRKEWYTRARALHDEPYILGTELSFTDLFNRELSNYVATSLRRAIPSMTDGMKHSQRQIMWGLMEKFKSATGPYTKIKVAQFANAIATLVAYHHNEDCLSGAIINMAMDFVCSNNLELLIPRGEFGTRIQGGGDHASPRYIFTEPSEWVYLLFRKEDLAILERMEDDGEAVEPASFHPVIPIAPINGSEGMATCWSTNIPAYNPRDITDYIIWWLKRNYNVGKTFSHVPELVPAFVGFKGEIRLIKDAPYDPNAVLFIGENVHKENEFGDDSDDEDDSTEEIVEEVDTTIRSDAVEYTGVFTIDRDGVVNVTELPPGRWMATYYKWLQDLKKKKMITAFKDFSTAETPNYFIYGFEKPTHKKLNLVKRISLGNMVFLDQNDAPIKFPTIQKYLDAFSEHRITIYEKRRTCRIVELDSKIATVSEEIRFLEAIVDDVIVINKRKKAEITADMEAIGINPKIYTGMLLSNLDEEGLAKCRKELRDYEVEKEELEKITAAEMWMRDLSELSERLQSDKTLDRTYDVEVKYSRKRSTIKDAVENAEGGNEGADVGVEKEEM